jgi:RIO-like serine/threonine protein kinase
MPVPDSATVLRQYPTTITIWSAGNRLFKQQPKYMTDNEYFFLKKMESTSYVPPDVRQEDIETISMEYIHDEPVTDTLKFRAHFWPVLYALAKNGIRHGDLTKYSVVVNNNRPYIIDFSESRWITDPIPSKRPQSDAELLEKAFRAKIAGGE